MRAGERTLSQYQRQDLADELKTTKLSETVNTVAEHKRIFGKAEETETAGVSRN